jgi:hypothetical protein
MAQRFDHAVEHQADAHTGAEHHRDPGHRPELRLLPVLAERDPAVAAERQPEREQDEAGRCEDEQPAELGDHPVERAADHRPQGFGPERAPEHQRDGEDGDRPEDDLVGRHLAGLLGLRWWHSVLAEVSSIALVDIAPALS